MWSLGKQSGLGLLRSADLADHQHGVGLGVVLERLEHVAERGAVDRVAADADRGRDADAERLHLRRRLVAERARAADDADAAGKIDVPGMMPSIALPGEIVPAQFGPVSTMRFSFL